MRTIKLLLVSLTLFSLSHFVCAANEDYEKMAQTIRQEIWNWDLPHFNDYTIPAQYDTCSSVILAWHIDINVAGKKKFRYNAITMFSSNPEITYTNIDRVMIKINDKKALDNYSEFDFQQFKKANNFITRDILTAVFGARIIKPDGSIVEVDISQATTILNEKSNKQRKLAISGLQIGDILDYFIYDEYKMESTSEIPATFALFSDIPILSYSIHCETGKNIVTEYRLMNEAPDFTSSYNSETNNFILDLKTSNLQVLTDNIWLNPLRQLPIIRMRMSYPNKNSLKPQRDISKGNLIKNISYKQILKDAEYYACFINEISDTKRWSRATKKTQELLNVYKQNHPDATTDDIISFAYYALRHCYFGTVEKDDAIVVDNSRNSRVNNLRTSICISLLERLLAQITKDKFELGFAATNRGADLEEIFSDSDTDIIITQTANPARTLTYTSPFTNAWYIPEFYENEKASTIAIDKYNRVKKTITGQEKGIVTFPILTADDNKYTTKLSISIDNLESTVIERDVTLTGHFKETYQKVLLLYEDYNAEERKYLGINKSLIDEMQADKNLQKLIPDYRNAFEKARTDQKKSFKQEIEVFHDADIKEIIEYEIINSGIFHTKPEFNYRTKYITENLLQKAGKDYIFKAGLLIGNQTTLTQSQRNRQIDAYMAFPSSRNFIITIKIPDGYKVENVDNFNKNIENSCGTFYSKASVANNEIYISVNRIIKNNYIPLPNWNDLLSILDAATDFNNQNIVMTHINE